MKVCITADWHINKDNRLEDMERTIVELVRKVISVKPKWFIFIGDAYKNWRPTPLEMNIFHEAMLAIASQYIKVTVVMGNHDYPESNEYRGMHCFSELKTLISDRTEYRIHVIDKPSVINTFSEEVSAIFIPYIPKNVLNGTYEKTFAQILKEQIKVADKKPVLFSHVFLSEAKIGAGDIEIITNTQVSAKVLRKAKIEVAFLGDIHKAQRIEPNYYYTGSIERIDFGERDDMKGFIVYDTEEDKSEFIELDARRLEQVTIDLVNPGFIKEGVGVKV